MDLSNRMENQKDEPDQNTSQLGLDGWPSDQEQLLELCRLIVTPGCVIPEDKLIRYGGQDNIRSRLQLRGLESIIEVNNELVINTMNMIRTKYGFEIGVYNMKTIQIGTILLLSTSIGFAPSVVSYVNNGIIQVVCRGQNIKPTGLVLDARLMHNTTSKSSIKLMRSLNGRKAVVLNKETYRILNLTDPRLPLEIASKEDTEDNSKRIIIGHISSRRHHGNNREQEIEVLNELLDNNKEYTLLGGHMSKLEMRLFTKDPFPSIEYNRGKSSMVLECVDSKVALVAAQMVKSLFNLECIEQNMRLTNRILLENLAQCERITSRLMQVFKQVGETYKMDFITRMESETVETLTMAQLFEKFRIQNGRKNTERWLNVYEDDKDSVLTFRFTAAGENKCMGLINIEQGFNLSISSRSGIFIRPFTGFDIITIEGGSEREKLINELQKQSRAMTRNIDANELVSDTHRVLTNEAPKGKSDLERMSRWLEPNKWTQTAMIDISQKTSSKYEIIQKKFPWHELFTNLDNNISLLNSDGHKAVYTVHSLNEEYIYNTGTNEGASCQTKDEYNMNKMEDHRIMDLWSSGLDLVDHCVMHAPKNNQKYKVKTGAVGLEEFKKTIMTRYPVQARPVLSSEAYASLNSLTGRIGRSIKIRKPEFQKKSNVRRVINKMKELFMVDNCDEMLNQFAMNPLTINEVELKEWILGHRRAHKVVEELEVLAAEGLETNPLNKFRSHVKLESLNKSSPIMDMRQSAPRAIIWLPYCMPAIFSYIFKAASTRLKEILRPEVRYVVGMNIEELKDFCASFDVGDNYVFDSDISKMDSQVDELSINIEWEILAMLGVPSDMLDSYKKLKKSWRIKNQFLSVTGEYMRHSGEPTTALGNGIINLATTAESVKGIKREDITMMMFVGDDMVMFTKKKIDVSEVKKRGRDRMNMILKPSINPSVGPFCSFLVGKDPITNRCALVPNIIRLNYKWEVPNGQHEITDDAIRTRQMSYACMMGKNKYSTEIQNKIDNWTNGELTIPAYYDYWTMITLNSDFFNMVDSDVTGMLMSFYESINRPVQYSAYFLTASENVRRFVKRQSQNKESKMVLEETSYLNDLQEFKLDS
nr:TPA_asm: hypothetical protein [Alphaendornavirus pemphredoni 1]